MIAIQVLRQKRRGWVPGEFKIDIYKLMTSEGPWKIKILILEIFLPLELDSHKYKILQKAVENCSVKFNLEGCMEIKMNLH